MILWDALYTQELIRISSMYVACMLTIFRTNYECFISESGTWTITVRSTSVDSKLLVEVCGQFSTWTRQRILWRVCVTAAVNTQALNENSEHISEFMFTTTTTRLSGFLEVCWRNNRVIGWALLHSLRPSVNSFLAELHSRASWRVCDGQCSGRHQAYTTNMWTSPEPPSGYTVNTPQKLRTSPEPPSGDTVIKSQANNHTATLQPHHSSSMFKN